MAVDSSGDIFYSFHDDNQTDEISNGVEMAVAGNNQQGYSGDGGPAISAQVNEPLGTAVDPSGNIYIADTGNNRIRRVDTKGIITTVAGNGTPGFSGDGAAAASAELAMPSDVLVDNAGNLYLIDSGNQRIRKVSGWFDFMTILQREWGDGHHW